ncbi:MAG TPA: DUF2946 family protein [Usitatibacter sp.]|nr:DUF2946 family protein [Usitatibacter sp.]
MNRRIVALCALLAVAWTALWPLIASAHALAFAESMPLCHQAGMQVGADEASNDETPAAPQSPKQHCPLCIMAFFAMPAATAIVAADRIAPVDLSSDFRSAASPADLTARLPESRAPPASHDVTPA